MISMIKLNAKDNNENIHDLLDKMANEVRNISENLQPSALKELGLIPTISDLIDFYQNQENSPKITFQYFNTPQVLDENIAINIYRFIQEALQNSIKHSECSEILVQVNGEDGGLSVLIEDNGKGFDPKKGGQWIWLEKSKKKKRSLSRLISTWNRAQVELQYFWFWSN